MKFLFTLFLTAFALSCLAQPGIRVGPNFSMFTHGDEVYSGSKHASTGVNVGLYEKLKLSNRFDLQGEIAYQHLGAKNPEEAPETFSTYSIHVPITVSLKMGNWNIQAGGYINKLVGARNDTFSGVNDFSWPIVDWHYYHKYTGGMVAGIGYDLQGMIIEAHFMRSIVRAQREFDKWKDLGYDQAADVSLYVPFKTFSRK